MEGARLPFWKGEIKGRDRRTGELFGEIYHSLQNAYEMGGLSEELRKLGLDESAVCLASGYLERQICAVGGLPDNKTIYIEHFKDSSGNYQVMFHSVFGKRVNAPLALLAAQEIKERFQIEAGNVDEEEGFLLYSYGDRNLPEGILQMINPDTCIKKLEILLSSTPLFNMAFRYNSGRALMMGVKKNGRLPLWMQRLKSSEMLEQVVKEKEHPLIRETKRECMRELWDAEGVKGLLTDIRSGIVEVREVYTQLPSPMSLPLQWGQEAAVMYDYSPTPRGIYGAVEEALKQEKKLLRPGNMELDKVQKRGKLPKDEKQLHSLLMTEGDLSAGELDIPIEWLESLAKNDRVIYLEQGLWIAAEEREKYSIALSEEHLEKIKDKKQRQEERILIVRRMLRYRGAANANQAAERYGWTNSVAEEIMEELCRREEAVKQEDIYYHAVLYRRARVKTLKNRREEAHTCPAENYAAFLLSRAESNLPPEDCMEKVLRQYAGSLFPASYWEGILLSKRVRNYREAMLDNFLSKGEFFWHMKEKGNLCFCYREEIDWEADVRGMPDGLNEKEKIIYEALLKRGASFMQSLNSLLSEESPYETLMSLLEKGLIYADSFVPVRQWLSKEKTKKATARQRVNMRVKALSAGRWDIVRPLKEPSIEECMEKCFDRYFILCKETAISCGVSWQEALSVLRIWEYTGQARRGYFVEGLSGVQFIRGKDYDAVIRMLQKPEKRLVWINAADPAQCWGKILPHKESRNFLNVPGSFVACCSGLPVAVMERQGKALRIFEKGFEEECLMSFAEEFKKGKIFSGIKRVVIKEYPDNAKDALSKAGFLKEMKDYVLYK